MKTQTLPILMTMILITLFSCNNSNEKKDRINESTVNFNSESGSFIDQRDGQKYTWKKIGNQIWMTENLRYLPKVSGPGTGSNSNAQYYIYEYYGDIISDAISQNNYTNHGVLYNWPAAMSSCPKGWHLPSNAEFDTLISNLNKELSSDCFCIKYSGRRRSNNTFESLGYGSYWWTSRECNAERADYIKYCNHDLTFEDEDCVKEYGYSVRCIKD